MADVKNVKHYPNDYLTMPEDVEEKRSFAKRFLDELLYYIIAPLVAFAIVFVMSPFLAFGSMLFYFSFLMLSIGLILTLWGVNILRNKVARYFVVKKGKSYAILITRNKKLKIVKPKRVGRFLVRVGRQYFITKPEDVFIGPDGSTWTILLEGASVFSPLGLYYNPIDAESLSGVIKGNLVINDEEYHMVPDPNVLDKIVKDLKDKVKSIVIYGFSLPLGMVSDLAPIEHYINMLADERAYRFNIERKLELYDIMKMAIAFVIVIIGGIIAYNGFVK